MSAFNFIQTFYVDPDTVANAPEIMLSSIDVFFKTKPRSGEATSGATNPAVSAWICEVEGDSPNVNRVLRNSVQRIEYDRVGTSGDASVATTIGFGGTPVHLATGRYYGIVLKFEDSAYVPWINKQGDRLIVDGQTTNQPSSGSQGRFDGKLYVPGNVNVYRSLSDRDLKFKVNVAQFISNNVTINLVNRDYEFFTIDNTRTGGFFGGEFVYQNIANASGTVAVTSSSNVITGTSTTFTNHGIGDKIVVASGGSTDVLTVSGVTNTTSMTVDRFPSFTASGIGYKVPPGGEVYTVDYTKDRLILVDSTANSTVKFSVGGGRLVGVRSTATANIESIDRWKVDNFRPAFLVGNPVGSNFTLNFRSANSANQLSTTASTLDLLQFNEGAGEGYILSRSVEVDTSASSNLFGDNRKSAIANLVINVTIPEEDRFSVPYATSRELDFYFYQSDVNNTYTTTKTRTAADSSTYSVTSYDTETEANGTAKSKYISKKINFAADKYAEDIVVYMAANRPAGTNIKVYAKIHNAADRESFESKAWTPLQLKDNVDKFTSDDPTDLVEYTYGFPQYPEVDTILDSEAIITYNSNNITTSTDLSGSLGTNDLILIRDPDFDNHEVYTVSTANSTVVELYDPVTTSSLVSSGSDPKVINVERLKYRNTAWNNIANDNVVRYISSSVNKFDYYTSMQIKVVLLAEQSHIIPKVEQIQVIGASA
jgi:hypothetical protein